MEITKAVRRKVKIKLAVTGPSGSGKTYSALRLAKGLGGKVCVIDTENCSASLYSDRFEFDVIDLKPPFTTESYQQALKMIESQGYDVCIVDSISHAWSGEGGLLEQKEKLDARGGNSFANWGAITIKHEKFKSAILGCQIHVICNMRSKQDYVLTEKNGKQVPKKVGLAPIQRDGIEYDFTTVFDIAMNHEAQTSKDRSGLFTDQIFMVTEETGQQINEWLSTGKEMPVVLTNKDLFKVAKQHDFPLDDLNCIMQSNFGVESSNQLKQGQIRFLMEYVKNYKKYEEGDSDAKEEKSKDIPDNSRTIKGETEENRVEPA